MIPDSLNVVKINQKVNKISRQDICISSEELFGLIFPNIFCPRSYSSAFPQNSSDIGIDYEHSDS